ncbi:MAG: hypothetical protein IIY32_03615, partial [Thermoguttaceae bacterium]|nr:hypothetical protein [Thermoguttaceae bacterium]
IEINDRKAGLSLTINTKRVNGKKARQRAFWLTNAGPRKKKIKRRKKTAVKRRKTFPFQLRRTAPFPDGRRSREGRGAALKKSELTCRKRLNGNP